MFDLCNVSAAYDRKSDPEKTGEFHDGRNLTQPQVEALLTPPLVDGVAPTDQQVTALYVLSRLRSGGAR